MVQMVDTGDGQMDEEEEDDEPQDRSRSPSPPLSVFAGPIVKYVPYVTECLTAVALISIYCAVYLILFRV